MTLWSDIDFIKACKRYDTFSEKCRGNLSAALFTKAAAAEVPKRAPTEASVASDKRAPRILGSPIGWQFLDSLWGRTRTGSHRRYH